MLSATGRLLPTVAVGFLAASRGNGASGRTSSGTTSTNGLMAMCSGGGGGGGGTAGGAAPPPPPPSSSSPSSSSSSSSFRMVALDMDGTLLNRHHQLSDVSIQTLRDLSAGGTIVALATGRSAPAVYEHVKKLSLPRPLPVVCYNGGSCRIFPAYVSCGSLVDCFRQSVSVSQSGSQSGSQAVRKSFRI